jgi:hypothetical protein
MLSLSNPEFTTSLCNGHKPMDLLITIGLARILKPGKLPKFVNMGNLLGVPILGQSDKGHPERFVLDLRCCYSHGQIWVPLGVFFFWSRLAKHDVPR